MQAQPCLPENQPPGIKGANLTYSSLPSSIVPTWGLPKNYKCSLVKKNFDGGIIERGSANSINAIAHSYQVKSFVKDIDTYFSVDSFFSNLKFRPFIYQGTLYRCTSYDWVCDRNLWTFNATFQEVFR
jgi:hypothetical protein